MIKIKTEIIALAALAIVNLVAPLSAAEKSLLIN